MDPLISEKKFRDIGVRCHGNRAGHRSRDVDVQTHPSKLGVFNTILSEPIKFNEVANFLGEGGEMDDGPEFIRYERDFDPLVDMSNGSIKRLKERSPR